MMSFLLIAIIIFVASFVQGLSGFGFGMLSMALLPLIVGVKTAIPLVAIYGLLITSVLLCKMRMHIQKEIFLPLLIGLLIGVPLGVYFLIMANEGLIRETLGFVIILTALYFLIFNKKEMKGINNGWGYLAGGVSGALGGAFNMGGPPAVIYIFSQNRDKIQSKAILQAVFTVSIFFRLAIYGITGILTKEVLYNSLCFLPFVIMGTWAGFFLFARLNSALIKKIIYSILLTSGILFLLK